MAEAWIRMRGSLVNNPRVIALARALLADPDFLDWYGHDSVKLQSSRTVTIRHVTVVTRVTVGALVPLWSMVNECAEGDGFLRDASLFEVDVMAGVPGFGKAMVAAGWLEECPDGGIRFPNFSEHNTVQESRSTSAKTPAQRAKEYRERHRDESHEPSRNSSRDGVTEKRDASRDAVTTEKSREEKNTPHTPTGADIRFERFWAAYPRKVAKDAARKAFDKRKPDSELLAQMLEAIRAQKQSDDWLKDGGQFIPHPATWLNQGRWQDDILAGAGGGSTSDWTAGAH